MSSHPSTILVIEDDTDFRFMLNVWLRTAGYQGLEASHGGEGDRAGLHTAAQLDLHGPEDAGARWLGGHGTSAPR
jgi:DNA-binding response OmpR family regulator